MGNCRWTPDNHPNSEGLMLWGLSLRSCLLCHGHPDLFVDFQVGWKHHLFKVNKQQCQICKIAFERVVQYKAWLVKIEYLAFYIHPNHRFWASHLRLTCWIHFMVFPKQRWTQQDPPRKASFAERLEPLEAQSLFTSVNMHSNMQP